MRYRHGYLGSPEKPEADPSSPAERLLAALRSPFAGSGVRLPLSAVADDLADRLVSLFREGADGRRPVHGPYDKFHTDPAWHDVLPFHEYFHGDTGAGLGASHQTGWTGLVADLLLRREP